jgi:hypothetical protein
MRTLLACLTATALVLACGGSDSDRKAELYAQASAKEAEARLLGVDQPCVLDNQCGGLRFRVLAHSCTPYTYKAYSELGPKASEAEAAALQQQSLAAEYISLLPPPEVACAGVVPAAPVFACVANQCVMQ